MPTPNFWTMMLRERIKYAATAAVTQATSIIAYSSVMRYVDSSCARINSSSRIISKGYRRSLKYRTLH
jgi:hypothetical protein